MNRFAQGGFPTADLQKVAAKIRGDASVTMNQALESATWIQGYALSFTPDNSPPLMSGSIELPEDAKLDFIAEQFESMSSMHANEAEAVPIGLILQLVTSLLSLWIKR